jgi:hypothetical protein
MERPLVHAEAAGRRSAILWLVVAALLVAGIACTCNLNPVATQNPSGGGSSGSSGGGGQASLTVVNRTSETVCYMRISPTTSDTWGEDWLGADMISSGESYTWPAIAAGSYDLRAEFCGGGETEWRDVDLTGSLTWTLQ